MNNSNSNSNSSSQRSSIISLYDAAIPSIEINISNLKCTDHKNININGMCIDEKCQIKNKLVCNKCININHKNGKRKNKSK